MKASARIPSLDGWRGISILLVLIGHEIVDGSHFRIQGHGKILQFFSWHLYGVQIFFVISGFIITHLLLKEESANGKINILAFYVRRFYRIIPALFTYLFVLFLLSFFFQGEQIAPFVWFISLFFMANFISRGTSWSTGHLWSLSVEEQYYFFWPLLFTFPRWRVILPAFFIVLAPCLRIIEYRHPGTVGEFSFFTHADAIFTGALFALLREQVEWRKWKKVKVAVIGLTAFCLLAQKFAIPYSGFITVPFTYTFFSAAVIILIDRSLHINSFLYAFFNQRWLIWIGKISYSLYLWQQLFFRPSVLGPGVFTTFPINFICMFVIAFCSSRFIEQPILNRKQQKRNAEVLPTRIG